MPITQRLVTPEQAGEYARRALEAALGYRYQGTPDMYAAIIAGVVSNPSVILHLKADL